MRINKFLAECHLGSRRKVETLVQEGLVTVNGIINKDFHTQINTQSDIVLVDGKIIKHDPQRIFLLMNKPSGYIVTKKDQFNRKTIYHLLPEFATKLNPIGRLDYDSEGLLLLTNDGEITNKITHPSFQIEKTYKVLVKGMVSQKKINQLREGVPIEDYHTLPAKVFLKKTTPDSSEIRISIMEGKNRQIRKMMEFIGHEVKLLKRLQIGDIKLEKIPLGSWRFLTDKEILYLIKITKHKRT